MVGIGRMVSAANHARPVSVRTAQLLLVDPQLPVWLPEITISNLRVGAAAIDLRFFRSKGGDSDYEVLDKRGSLHVVRQPSPWSLTATFGERLQDALTSLVPGR